MTPQLYIVPPALYTLTILAAIAIVLTSVLTWWWLAALPFIYLGSVCAQPNMNLADGYLAWLALLVGLIVLAFHTPLGSRLSLAALQVMSLRFMKKRCVRSQLRSNSSMQPPVKRRPFC